jgi:hypothetical protein
MTRKFFLLVLVLASIVVLPTSVKAMETIEYGYQLGGEGKVIILGESVFLKENVVVCLYFGTNLAGDLLAGLMNINMSTESLGNPTLGFTGSVLGKDNPNMRITFFPLLLDPETQQPIPGDELIAFAAGSFNKKNMEMNFVIQSPNLFISQEYGAFTGNFELSHAGWIKFCSGN